MMYADIDRVVTAAFEEFKNLRATSACNVGWTAAEEFAWRHVASAVAERVVHMSHGHLSADEACTLKSTQIDELVKTRRVQPEGPRS